MESTRQEAALFKKLKEQEKQLQALFKKLVGTQSVEIKAVWDELIKYIDKGTYSCILSFPASSIFPLHCSLFEQLLMITLRYLYPLATKAKNMPTDDKDTFLKKVQTLSDYITPKMQALESAITESQTTRVAPAA